VDAPKPAEQKKIKDSPKLIEKDSTLSNSSKDKEKEVPKPAEQSKNDNQTSSKSTDIKDKPKEKPTPKKETKPIVKKYEAVANGVNLHISPRQSQYICAFIKNKEIDEAILDLNLVIAMKKPVPFKGEIPHRKGKIQSGRYPQKASKLFIDLLKSLKGNIIVNGMDLDKSKIIIASATNAQRPQRRGGTEAKRTNVLLKAKEVRSPKRKSPQPKQEVSQQERIKPGEKK
jgi:ribosomal protein L22